MRILKLKSVQAKFLLWIIPVIGLILSALAYTVYQQEREKQLKTIDEFSIQVVQARGHEIEKWLNSLILELQQIARNDKVRSLDWQVMESDLKEIGEKRKATYDFLILIEKDGFYYSTLKGRSDKSLNDKIYFKELFEEQKEYAISNPYISVTTSEPIFVVGVPVKDKNGNFGGAVAGIVHLSTLSRIAGDMKVGKKGYGWIVDNEGLIFAHPDNKVAMQLNVLQSADKGFKNLDRIGKEMLEKESGTGLIVTAENEEEYLIYSRIPLSPGWTLGVAVPTHEVFDGVKQLLITLLVSFAITLLIISLGVWLLTRNIISRPLKTLIGFTNAVSQGHLFEQVSTGSNDEVGSMAGSLKSMSLKLKDIAARIRQASDNIAEGSKDISSTAAQIATGAGEQASSTEEVSASMEQMVASINQNADNAMQTERMAIQAANDIEAVKASVETTIAAITQITQKISVISEIAERTDLLAINAAIEAARAGQSGKGFAVVAAEVRKLAENSQKAAIEINAVSASTVEVAQRSGQLLAAVYPIIHNNANLVREISAASIEQNSGAEQINNALQQLAQITQENSAASEEMASASEELARQAELLRDIVAFFKVSREEMNTDMTDMAYEKLLEALSVLKANKTSLKKKKPDMDIAMLDALTASHLTIDMKATEKKEAPPDPHADDTDKNYEIM